MTVNHLVTGSNPVSGAILHKSLKQALPREKQTSEANYDTKPKVYATKHLRLYRVNEIYYYRRRIKQKLFRISLHTKNLQEALKRKKTLDLLRGEEMFKLETKDFKLVFEYDTAEELKTALENAMQMQVQAQVQRFKEVKQHIEFEAQNEQIRADKLTFEALKDKYISQVTYDGNVGKSSIEAYITTFKYLTKYFNDKDINSLSVQDIEAFKLHLNSIIVRGKNLSKNRINKHLIYTKQFLKFAEQRGYIQKNIAEPVKLYNKKQVEKEKPKKENYTRTQIRHILNYDNYQDPIYTAIYKIAVYTGMRQGELRLIEKEDIKRDKDNILYIDIPESKSEAGVRKIPVHKDIEELVLNTDFPFFDLEKISKNAFSKKVRYQLKKALEDDYKDFHTLRATFVENIINANYSENELRLKAIQEIVGHAGNEADNLTTQTYAKGFSLQQKKELIDRVSY